MKTLFHKLTIAILFLLFTLLYLCPVQRRITLFLWFYGMETLVIVYDIINYKSNETFDILGQDLQSL